MCEIEPVEYRCLATEHCVTPETWDEFVRDVLVEFWLAAYRAAVNTPTEILEVTRGELTFLFDAQSVCPRAGTRTAPSRCGDARRRQTVDAIGHGSRGSSRTHRHGHARGATAATLSRTLPAETSI
jgi:hypothetical protein